MLYQSSRPSTLTLGATDAERLNSEGMLRRTAIWMALAASVGRLGFWSFDLQSRHRWMSTEVWRILGLEQRGTPESAFLDAIHPDDRDRVLSARARTLRAGAAFDDEFRLVKPDGDVRWVHATGRVLHDRDGEEFLGVMADVTTRKQAELEMLSQECVEDAPGYPVDADLSGAVLHELKQPLTAILLNAEAAAGLLDEAADAANVSELRQIVDEIICADRRANAMMGRIRSLLQNEPPEKERLPLSDLINDVLAITHGDILLHQVAAEGLADPAMPPAFGDRVQLQQVLINLVMNACEAMDSRPPAERRLTIKAAPDVGGSSRLTVADTGGGIALRPPSSVFEPFVTSKPNGLGLGLAICRKVVAAHGGRIGVDNNELGGATFHVWLPAIIV